MNDSDAIAALVNDLQWQIDQLGPRGIKDKAGNTYNPAYYKRGLNNAIDRGGLEVAEYVRRYLYKAPSDGYRKLADADSLDLACEALVADDSRPYAHLFTEADRAAARKRLAPHIDSIEKRKAVSSARIETRRSELPDDVEQLRQHAAETTQPEDAIAVNMAILQPCRAAHNRLGRAYEARSIAQAKETFHTRSTSIRRHVAVGTCATSCAASAADHAQRSTLTASTSACAAPAKQPLPTCAIAGAPMSAAGPSTVISPVGGSRRRPRRAPVISRLAGEEDERRGSPASAVIGEAASRRRRTRRGPDAAPAPCAEASPTLAATPTARVPRDEHAPDGPSATCGAP